ncbi:MAG: type I restriction endonuclease [Pseudomonadota bacterium]
MDLRDAARDLAKRARVTRETAETEEATKNSAVMPFIRALGFDVFDLQQVVPEFVADVGTRKGEKVDYALKIEDKIVMLVEAKPISMDLGSAQYNQLYRYFSVTSARIGILTNGCQYWFFSDIDEQNRMDKRPFFKFDLESFDDEDVKELEKFHRESFSIEKILATASTLKYTSAAANYIKSQLEDPGDELVRIIGRQIYDGNLTKATVDQLRSPIRLAFQQIIRERIQERLDRAFSPSSENEVQAVPPSVLEPSEITTTEEELGAFHILRAIGSEVTDPNRITLRDAKTYCSMFMYDNNRRPVCRLYFHSRSKRHVGVFDSEKKEIKHEISDIAEIFKFKGEVQAVISHYSKV